MSPSFDTAEHLRIRDDVLALETTSNWCPKFQRDVFESPLPESALHSIARLPPSPYSDHRHCTQTECRSGRAADRGRPQHCVDKCNCPLVQAPLDKIKEIVQRKAVPLIRVKIVDGAVQLDIEEADYNHRYIAFSHVWTGGLGNETSNALYSCQLKELAKAGRQIRQSIHSSRDPSFPNLFRSLRRYMRGDIDLFWLDTLCIPPKQIHDGIQTLESRQLRKLALNRMTQIYANAYAVMMVDPELRRVSLDEFRSDPRVAYSRLRRCDWMRRCWTWHEAAMSARFFVKLSSGQVLYLNRERALWERPEQSYIPVTNPRYVQETSREAVLHLTEWFTQMPAPRKEFEYTTRQIISNNDVAPFIRVWNTLRSRHTSWPTDAVIIFALLVNLTPGGLEDIGAEIPPEIAMDGYLRTLFNSVDVIPLDFIFKATSFREPFWLPRDGINCRLDPSSVYLRRGRGRPNELLFDTSDTADGRQPGLYLLPIHSPLTLYVRLRGNGETRDARVFKMSLSPRKIEDVIKSQLDLLLLINDADLSTSQYGGIRRAAILESLFISTTNDWTLRRLCAIDLIPVPDGQTQLSLIDLDDDLLPCSNTGHRFIVQCDFTGAQTLQDHREHQDTLIAKSPGYVVATTILSDLHGFIGLFHIIYMAIMAPIVFTHNPASFPFGFYIFLLMFWSIQLLVQVFGWRSAAREGDHLTHSAWINDLNPSESVQAWPSPFPRRQKPSSLQIQYSKIETWLRIIVALVMIVVGIMYRRKRNVRWLTAWGFMILMELMLRYIFLFGRIRSEWHSLVHGHVIEREMMGRS